MRKRSVSSIKTVGGVSSNSGVALLNAYRRGLSARDWGEQQRRKLEGIGPRAEPPAASPGEPPPLLNVTLYVTRDPRSALDWEAIQQLLAGMQSLFEPARLRFQLTEPDERPDARPGKGCPFHADLDHEYEWLHLAFCAGLPGDVLPSCGRCCLVRDAPTPRSLAHVVGRLLGLLPNDTIGVTQTLMSVGPGVSLSEREVEWLRWQARVMLGQSAALSPLKVPVWAYQVLSPEGCRTGRQEADVRAILERVNSLWHQAGMEFELRNWCHLQEHDLDAETWRRTESGELALLTPLTEFGPRALHLVFTKASQPFQLAPPLGLALIGDALQRNRTMTLGHILGALLGLPTVSGSDQLMSSGLEGTRLSPAEIARAREAAVALSGRELRHTPPTPPLPVARSEAAPALSVHEVTLDLYLIRGAENASRLSLEEARQTVERTADIWRQAAIEVKLGRLVEIERTDADLDPAYPTDPAFPGPRVPARSSLTRGLDCDSRRLSVFVAHTFPRNASGAPAPFMVWHAHNVLFLPESFPRHSPEKHLALALAAFWRLSIAAQGPYYRLLVWYTAGTRLTAQDVEKARATFAPPRHDFVVPPCDLPEISIPVVFRLHVGEPQGCAMGLEEASRLWTAVNAIWGQAGVRWDVQHSQAVKIPPEAVGALSPPLPDQKDPRPSGGDGILAMSEYESGSVNVFLVRSIPFQTGESLCVCREFPQERLLVANEKLYSISSAVALSQALARFLGLPMASGAAENLTTYHTDGVTLTPGEIEKARTQAGLVNQALMPRRFLSEALAPLHLPVRLHLVRHPDFGTQSEMEALLARYEPALEHWTSAAIRVELKPGEVVPMDAELIRSLELTDDSDYRPDFVLLKQHPCFRPEAMNLFVFRQFPYTGTRRYYASGKGDPRCFMMIEQSVHLSPTKLFSRVLLSYLGVPVNRYSPPESMGGNSSDGVRLEPHEIYQARARLAEYFPSAPAERETRPESSVPVPGPGGLLKVLPRGGDREPIRVRLVRNARYGCTLSAEEVLARFPGGTGWDAVEVSDEALAMAFPNPPGALSLRVPMNFGLMRLPGHDPLARTVLVAGRLEGGPFSSFPGSRMLLVAQDSLAAGLAAFLT